MSKHDPQPSFRIGTEYFFTALAAWLIPGSGHWLLGYRVRGAMMGVLVLGLFWIGQVLAYPPAGSEHARTPMAVSRQTSPIFFTCQLGNGFSTVFSNLLWGEPRYPKSHKSRIDVSLPRRLNLAILFTSVSGLLNYLLVLHILDPRTWTEAATARAEASRQEEPPSGQEKPS